MFALPTWCQRDKTLALLLLILLAFSSAYILALCKLCCVDGGQVYSFAVDDIMIGLRYAYNCAHGYGLVWNPGERIQGYTNLGWVLFITLIHCLHLPLSWNPLLLQLTNGLLHVILIVYWFRILRVSYGDIVALAAAAIMAFNASLFLFTVEGHETTILCLLTSVALSWCIVNPEGEIGITSINFCAPFLTALCVLVRADSIVIFGSAVLATFVAARLVAATRRQWVIALASTAGGVVLISGMLIWQKLYYGDFLPNTFYLRCNPSLATTMAGLKYVFWDFSMRDSQIAYLVGTACYLARGFMNAKSRANYWPLFIAVTPLFAYIIAIGGDFFPMGRFFTPVMPLLIVCCILFLRDCFRSRVSIAITGGRMRVEFKRTDSKTLAWAGEAFAVLMLYSLLTFPYHLFVLLTRLKLINVDTVAIVHVLQGLGLKSGDRIALFRAGAIPYYMPGFRFNDMLGKCDTYISHLPVHQGQLPGHNKFDMQYSLGKLQPAVVITSYPVGSEFLEKLKQHDPNFRNFVETMYADDNFQRYYMNNRVAVPVPYPAADQMWVFKREPAQ